MKFRKKPVVIEATRWFKNGDHPLDYSKDHTGFDNTPLRTFTAAERRENSSTTRSTSAARAGTEKQRKILDWIQSTT